MRNSSQNIFRKKEFMMENEIIERIEEQTVEQVSGGVSMAGLGKFAAGVGLGALAVLGITKLVKFVASKKQSKVEEAEYSEVESNDVTNNE